MNSIPFPHIYTSLLRAEDACISHLNELMFRVRPSRDDIEKAFHLVNELRQAQAAAMDSFALNASSPAGRALSVLIKHSAVTLSESLRIVDRLALNYHSRA